MSKNECAAVHSSNGLWPLDFENLAILQLFVREWSVADVLFYQLS